MENCKVIAIREVITFSLNLLFEMSSRLHSNQLQMQLTTYNYKRHIYMYVPATEQMQTKVLLVFFSWNSWRDCLLPMFVLSRVNATACYYLLFSNLIAIYAILASLYIMSRHFVCRTNFTILFFQFSVSGCTDCLLNF